MAVPEARETLVAYSDAGVLPFMVAPVPFMGAIPTFTAAAVTYGHIKGRVWSKQCHLWKQR
eukprot:3941214-Rhodomonas_salina.7